MRRYIKIVAITVLSFCIMTSVISADESKFIKIDGGLGLKDDGTLWKLPIETDILISALEYRYDTVYGDDMSDFRFPDDYDPENKKLRKLLRHGENIIDFSAHTDFVSQLKKEFSVFSLVTKNTDGIWLGYSANYFGITRLNLIDIKTQTAGCYANAYIDSEGDAYIYGGPVGLYMSSPIKIRDLKNAVSISHGMNRGFAVDSDGEIYQLEFYTDVNNQAVSYAEKLGREGKDILPEEKVTYLKFDNNGSVALLSDENHAFLMQSGGRANFASRKIELENVIAVDISIVPRYEWYKTNRLSTGASLVGPKHMVMLCSDGTVWQTEAVETYPYDDVEYQTTRLKTTLPVQIKGISDVVDIDVLADDILMLKSDGSIIKWGTTSYKDMHTDNPQKLETRNYNIALEIGKETMYINGSDVEIDPGRGTKSIEQNGRTYIPIRALIEAVGGSIEWSEAEQKVSMSLWGNELEMTIGSDKYYINGEAKQMDVSPILENSRTMVPVRFVGEAFGFTVDYDDNPLTAKLFYREILE